MNNNDIDPPEDDLEALAGEFALGLLDDARLAQLAQLRRRDQRFDAAVQAWETRLMPLAANLQPLAPPPELWQKIERAIAPAPASEVKPGIWNNLKFWRYFSLGAAALAAAGFAAALLTNAFLHSAMPAPAAVATLNLKTGGEFIATAQQAGSGVLLVVSPANVSMPAGKSAELWLIVPDHKPRSLGLLAASSPVAVSLHNSDAGGNFKAVTLAVSLEPFGGSPTGVATGPVIAATKFPSL